MELPPPKVIDPGTPGASAQREADRRRQAQSAGLEERWGTGRVGRIARRFAEEPQSTTAWAKGSDGERRLGQQLERDLADDAIVLHDRRATKQASWNIDHVVVAPSGVWVIDAKNYRGLVERRDHGTWRKVDDRLFVAGRDRTSLVNSMDWQVDLVGQLLRDIGQGHVPVHVALCFTDSEWSLFARPFKIDGVWIIWAKRLVKEIRRDGSLDEAAIRTIAQHLSAQLPPA